MTLRGPDAAPSAFTRVCDALRRRARNPDTSEFHAVLDSGLATISAFTRVLGALWARPGMTPRTT